MMKVQRYIYLKIIEQIITEKSVINIKLYKS